MKAFSLPPRHQPHDPVQLDAANPALAAIREFGPLIAPHLLISELRTVAADGIWLSPAFERECLGIHFTWRNDPVAVGALLPRIEEALAPYSPRPHWGKRFDVAGARLARLYPRYDDFVAIARRRDPSGKFRNAYLERTLGL